MELIIPGMTNLGMRAPDSPLDPAYHDEDDVRAGLTIPTVRCLFPDGAFSEEEAQVLDDIEAIGKSIVQRFSERALSRLDYDELADGIRLAMRMVRVELSDRSDAAASVAALGQHRLFRKAATSAAAAPPASSLLDLLTVIRDILRDELASRTVPGASVLKEPT